MFVERFSLFPQVILVCVIIACSPLVYAQDDRQVWEHSDGMFKDQGNGVWVETDRNGAILHKFLEVDRTSEFVQLYDSSRGYAIRLHGAAMYIKGGKKPNIKKFEEFTRLYQGKWVSAPQRGSNFRRDNEPPLLITIMPVFFIPAGERRPTEDQISRFMRHLQIAQGWYKNALSDGDTFTIARDFPEIIQGRHPISYYKDARERVCRLTGEILDHFRVNRYNCSFIFACIIMNSKEDWPTAGGTPFNGGVNLGGGRAFMSSFILDKCKFFQGVCMHELGHSFGLVHPNVYGLDMTTCRSIMAANVAFDGWSGFNPPSKPNILLPEDIRLLSWNNRVFPNIIFDPSKDVPSGYAIARPTFLIPLEIEGHPSYEPSIYKKK
jgi:hypothetical protein